MTSDGIEPQNDCPGCRGNGSVNVGRTGYPPVLIPCTHPDHERRTEPQNDSLRPRYRSIDKANAEIGRLRRLIAAAYYDPEPATVLEPEVTGSEI